MADEPLAPLDRGTAKRLAEALEEIVAHRIVRIHDSVWRVLLFQFMRGLAFGFGTVIGASILVSFVVVALSQVEFVPIIGDWATQVIEEIEEGAASRDTVPPR
ncbi:MULTISPECIES: DUF5665 domain-containing protein [unclassified Rhodosalinus]|uniref:DUF5665 domain-containing protein n=1 Tax=unclassified Rhodosalinus TaxID=2630183 RepID=UPI0035236126